MAAARARAAAGQRLIGESESHQLVGGTFLTPSVDLRQVLIDSLRPGTIRWGHKISRVIAIDNDTYELHFTFTTFDPSTGTGSATPASIRTDILIGADGAWSKVRPLLHDTKPHYTGVTMYDLQIAAADLSPELRAFVGKGTCMILEGGKGLIPQMNSGGKCRVYATVYDLSGSGLGDTLPAVGKKEWICGLYDGWDARCHALIRAADEETIVERKIVAVNQDLAWESELSGVTIIGESSFLRLHRTLITFHPCLQDPTADAQATQRTSWRLPGKVSIWRYTTPSSSAASSCDCTLLMPGRLRIPKSREPTALRCVRPCANLNGA